MLRQGDKAPSFSLKDSQGNRHRLSDYAGKKVILYFYPKDFTPGCTKQACSFRDARQSFEKKNAIIIGISADSEDKHAGFAEKYNLPFVLLSDPEKKVIRKYGALKEKSMFGRSFLGIQRSTFIIDEKGRIEKIFEKVKVKGHADEVLESL